MRKFQFEGKGNVSGDRVRELRLRARLSQTALAAKMQTEGAIIGKRKIAEYLSPCGKIGVKRQGAERS